MSAPHPHPAAPQPSAYEHIDDYYEALANANDKCWCGAVGIEYEGPRYRSDGTLNDAAYSCPNGHHRGWREKPRSKEQAKTRRPRRGKNRLAAPTGTDHCLMCHRTRDELRELGEQLEEAHDESYADKIDAGLPDDASEHAWLCTTHHRIQHLWIAEAERYRMHEQRLTA